jgi:hypothetical protein
VNSAMDKNCLSLSRKKARIIQDILSSRSIIEGCDKARISRSSFYKYMQEQAFKDEFERQRKAIINEGLHRLKVTMDQAVDVLIELLTSNNDGIRYRTAESMIDKVLKSTEMEDIENRLTEIERRISNGKY